LGRTGSTYQLTNRYSSGPLGLSRLGSFLRGTTSAGGLLTPDMAADLAAELFGDPAPSFDQDLTSLLRLTGQEEPLVPAAAGGGTGPAMQQQQQGGLVQVPSAAGSAGGVLEGVLGLAAGGSGLGELRRHDTLESHALSPLV
jgi:hypothetical protein